MHTQRSQGLIDQTRKKGTVKLSTTKLTPQPDKFQGQFCSLESESGSHSLIRHKNAAANLRLCNNLEVGLVNINAHEEDLGRNGPLKVVVVFTEP